MTQETVEIPPLAVTRHRLPLHKTVFYIFNL